MTTISSYHFDNAVYVQKLQSVAIEKALIDSITDTASETVIGIISMLEKWSTRTYEGSNVSMGIFVNLMSNNELENSVSYFDIIDHDFFARLTDGVSSFVEFDRNDFHLLRSFCLVITRSSRRQRPSGSAAGCR